MSSPINPETQTTASALSLNTNIKIVLMRTTHPGNIGSVARAMKTMGLSQLCLVQPECFPSAEAYPQAVGAKEILDQAQIVDTIDAAIGECHLVVGASARTRNLSWPLTDPRQTSEMLVQQVLEDSSLRIALLFGQEASGLSNDELQRCNYHVHIPSVESFSSLNLAMAVQILCYELRMASLAVHSQSVDGLSSRLKSLGPLTWTSHEPLATSDEVGGLLSHMECVMTELEFLNPEKPGRLIPRLRRLFQRAHLDRMEVNILRGLLTAVQKKRD